MYDGYLKYGDVEVVNMERLMAYVDHGIVPAGVQVEDCTGTCDGLGEALGDQPYGSPMVDQPPWYNVDDPDSMDFAGVLPLEVTGLDGSTRTVEMVDLVTRGAMATRARYNARTIAVSAILIGRTSEGVQSGLSWLTDALHRTCSDDTGCNGVTLEAFTSCPTPICQGVELPDAPITNTPEAYDAATWLHDAGTIAGTVFTTTPGAELVRNSAVQPGAEVNATGLTSNNSGQYPVTRTTTSPIAGTGSWLTTRGGTLSATVASVTTTQQSMFLPGGAGQTASFGIDVKVEQPNRQVATFIQFLDLAGTPVGVSATITQPAPAPGTVVRRVHSAVAPASSASAHLVVQVTTTAGLAVTGERVWFDRALWATGTHPDAVAGVYFDGSTPNTATDHYQWLGAVNASVSIRTAARTGLLAGPVFDADGFHGADWTVTPPASHASVEVMVGAVSEDGSTILDQGPPVVVTGSTLVQWQPIGLPQESFRPALWVVGAGAGFSLVVHLTGTLTPEDCVAPYRRLFPQVTTVDGPTVVGTEVTDCGETLLRVEWTWVAGNPYRLATPVTLTAGANSTVDATLELAGVDTDPLGQISATPYNCAAPVAPATCVPDPCYPGFLVPPAGPSIPDTNRPSITTQNVRAVSVQVEPDNIPTNDGVFTITLANDASDKVGVRVRVYDNVLPAGPVDLCDFAYEYLIDYIAPDAIFTIDGVTGTASVLCVGQTATEDATRVMRGSYGGPVQDAVAACDRRYYIIVQWLALYPSTCTGVYTSGQPEGELTVSVAVAAREG